MIGDPDMMPKRRRKDRVSEHEVGEQPKSRWNERGSRHNAGELSKRKEIRIRCWRVAEKIGDPDTMSESRRKDRGFKHDAGEP